jgi:hypothetical protein
VGLELLPLLILRSFGITYRHPTRWARNPSGHRTCVVCPAVTTPRSGLGTLSGRDSCPQWGILPQRRHHPTQWAWEVSLTTLWEGSFFLHHRHPTQWAWNKKAIHFRKPLPQFPNVAIPHGGLGTEIFSVGSGNRKDNIAIPRGGLGTEEVNALYNEGQASLSPSHTVGLKHLPKTLKTKTLTLSKFRQPTERAH